MDLQNVLIRSRNETGKSQEFMAFELGVSRRTIQNWETGRSEPTFGQLLDWFRAMNKNPIPFLIQCVFPNMEGISAEYSDEELRAALQTIIEQIPPEAVRELMYLFYGDHGSSPRAVLNLVTAHLQTPLENRVAHATLITHNYEMAARRGKLANPAHIKPDLSFLQEAIVAGQQAVLKESGEYSVDVTVDYPQQSM